MVLNYHTDDTNEVAAGGRLWTRFHVSLFAVLLSPPLEKSDLTENSLTSLPSNIFAGMGHLKLL